MNAPPQLQVHLPYRTPHAPASGTLSSSTARSTWGAAPAEEAPSARSPLSEVLLVQPEDGLLAVGQLVARLLERGRDHRRAWLG